METVKVSKVNDVYLEVHTSPGVKNELESFFSFYAPNYQYHPQVKKGRWDGKIRLFNKPTGQLYLGLKNDLQKYCERNNYKFIDNITSHNYWVSDEHFEQFIAGLNLPHTPYDFQLDIAKLIIKELRGIILSPTSSGKSLIQYIICQYFSSKKFLVIVPTTNLVLQLATDFQEYGYTKPVHQIMAGAEKNNITPRITVTTWQSIKDQPVEWFDQFDAIMGDECHTFQAKSLIKIMTSCLNQDVRVGLSGSLPEEDGMKITLKGLFGPITRTLTTRQLIDNKQAAEIDITGIELQYSSDAIKEFKKYIIERKKTSGFFTKALEYIVEKDYTNNYIKRQDFIVKLGTSLPGNTLVLYKTIEHGKALFEKFKENSGKQCYFIYNKTKAEERDSIRKIMEQNTNIITVASFKTFATGTNIKNIQHIIFGEGTKSFITVIQAIGRGLRISATKTKVNLFDIGDSIVRTTTKQNYLWQHFVKRLEIYAKEKHKVSIKRIKL